MRIVIIDEIGAGSYYNDEEVKHFIKHSTPVSDILINCDKCNKLVTTTIDDWCKDCNK